MKEIYRLKNLARIGVVAMVSLLVWGVVAWCIPTFRVPESSQQLYTIRHQDLRDNNPLYTDLLLRSIKQHNGYLILGTSETKLKPEGNYFDFLNSDTTLHCGFSVISGAGRTPCVYFPLIQSNENVKDLKVIFYLNPSYGCSQLASSNTDYFNRYVSCVEYQKANHTKNQDIIKILEINKRNMSLMDRIGEGLGYYVDQTRRKYYQDLRFHLHRAAFEKDLKWQDTMTFVPLPDHAPRPDSNQYRYDLNVLKSFNLHTYTLTPHPEESYRADELRTMIRLCKERGVDIVFVVGPYNQIAFSQVYPEEVAKIQQVSKNIVQVLKEENAAYIDCTDLSTLPGTFDDWQHHSSYGAYLIYQRIKAYVLEKENY